jgi:hypothetical protein
MPVPIFIAFVLMVLALPAVGLLIFVIVRRRKLPSWVADWWVKITAEFVSFGAAGVGLWATYTIFQAQDRSVWLCPAMTGGFCVAVWKGLQHYVEWRVKSADKSDRKVAELLKAESAFRSDLLAALRSFVKEKGDVTLEVIQERSHTPRIDDARRALTPGRHLRQILTTLALFLQTRCKEKLGKQLNVRVGVYAERGGVMTPVHAESLNQSHSDPFSSYRQHTDGFRVDNTARPSHVVQCLRQKRPIWIVEDCEEAEKRGEFHYYSDAQREYLKSIVLHFLGEISDEVGTMTTAVLSIDADQPRAFEESEREDLLLCLLEFGQRIKFEMLLRCLLG